MTKKTLFAGAALIMASAFVPTEAYSWTLSTHSSGGYRITCADGKKGHFDNYPTEFACNKVCEDHGGVVNLEPYSTGRLARAHIELSEKLEAAGISIEIDEQGNETVLVKENLPRTQIQMVKPERAPAFSKMKQ